MGKIEDRRIVRRLVASSLVRRIPVCMVRRQATLNAQAWRKAAGYADNPQDYKFCRLVAEAYEARAEELWT
jgi:hypothetical protein